MRRPAATPGAAPVRLGTRLRHQLASDEERAEYDRRFQARCELEREATQRLTTRHWNAAHLRDRRDEPEFARRSSQALARDQERLQAAERFEIDAGQRARGHGYCDEPANTYDTGL